MKGAPGVIIGALWMILALSSRQGSGLVHTAEPSPVGQLLRSERAPSGRHLLDSISRRVQDLEDEIKREEMTALEMDEEEEYSAEDDEALSLDTERVLTDSAESGSRMGASWPTFGLVGEKQAALYYGVCLLFTVVFLKNSGIHNSLKGIIRNNSHGKSARLGA